MRRVILHTISSGGTVATAIGLLVCGENLVGILRLSLWILMLLTTITVVVDWVTFIRSRPQTHERQSKSIAGFLGKWIAKGGKSVVFTRDMTWAQQGSLIYKTLTRKARNGELVLFVGRQTPDILGLVKAGATAFDYSALEFVPRVRFTLIEPGTPGARLAIGRGHGEKHTIKTFDGADDLTIALAEDLRTLAERQAARIT